MLVFAAGSSKRLQVLQVNFALAEQSQIRTMVI